MKKILYIGSKVFGARLLESLLAFEAEVICGVVTLDDQDDFRTGLSSFQDLAEKYDKELSVLKNGKPLGDLVETYQPDLCIVVGWYWMIKPETLALPQLGFIGVHNSLLPRFRGGSPLVWSIIEGGEYVGCSIFQLTEGVDEGGILMQREIELSREQTVGDALNKIENDLLDYFPITVHQYLSGNLRLQEQDLDQSTYCMPRKPEDGEVDWSQPAAQVHDFIRAQSSPYPGAFTYHQGERFLVTASAETGVKCWGVPGQVCYPQGEGVSVICGDGMVLDIVLDGGECSLKFGQKLSSQ